MAGQMGTTIARRQLGRRLRRLRIEAGRTLDDVAEAHVASATKMWRIETGRTSTKPGDVLALGRMMGFDPGTTDELVALAEATRGRGFQQDHDSPVAEWTGMYTDLEAATSCLRAYNSELIHGLLQTADYTRAVTAANPELDAGAVERLVEFRMQRQRSYFRRAEPGRLDVITTAGVLGLIVGSPATMAAQLDHLRALARRETIHVRVLTQTNGVHAAMRGDFTIMDFADEADPPLVYLESLIGSRYLERHDHLAMYRQAFDRIRAQAVSLEEYRP